MKVERQVTITEAVEILNEALRLEPEAVSALVRYRVQFSSEELADHPTIQVGLAKEEDEHGRMYDLGLLGLLNGIFGTETDRISITVDDDFYENPERLVEGFTAHTDWSDKRDAE